MPVILITPLSAVTHVLVRHAPSHLVTLLSSSYMIDTPQGFPAERHLRLAMHDIAEEDGVEPPAHHHIERLLEFGREWDGAAPMLVHCWAGVSRSTAAAYVILCDRAGPGSEMEIARNLRDRAPHAHPNRLLVRHADDVLGRGGAMVRAVSTMGSGTLVAEGVPVEMPVPFPKR